MVVCRYWLQGCCRYGNSCWYDHFKTTEHSSSHQVNLELIKSWEKELKEQESSLESILLDADEHYYENSEYEDWDDDDAQKIRNALLHGKELYIYEDDDSDYYEDEDDEDEEEDSDDEDDDIWKRKVV
ncbi:predicted protein [Naegleria gruberi]|uniref:Predicted protein n=1 Tax=Naegleria gruberi TaxID=5762 RepID=D2V0L0_NAEGR|nr:uncharacterized protein NAEGRDRAFT_62331 [Naegleria gruberi]EFC49541.1 predicted protein [Naegleria gruberi]|eukprot:XP_002682285.1 predicted protein [Naegleria gruberi strain NEG-M]